MYTHQLYVESVNNMTTCLRIEDVLNLTCLQGALELLVGGVVPRVARLVRVEACRVSIGIWFVL